MTNDTTSFVTIDERSVKGASFHVHAPLEEAKRLHAEWLARNSK